MKKTNLPDFQELIMRLAKCIQMRNPDKSITAEAIVQLTFAWEGKHKELYETVKKLEQNQRAAIQQLKETEDRVVEFQIGVDCVGFPIFVTHATRFQNKWRDPKRFSKEGSTFVSQKIVKLGQFLSKSICGTDYLI